MKFAKKIKSILVAFFCFILGFWFFFPWAALGEYVGGAAGGRFIRHFALEDRGGCHAGRQLYQYGAAGPGHAVAADRLFQHGAV